MNGSILPSRAMRLAIVASGIVVGVALAEGSPLHQPLDTFATRSYLTLPPSRSGIGTKVGEYLISWYQTRLSRNSVPRCPFLVSCSNYTLHKVRTRGFLWGTISFIDRSMYRENPGMVKYYPTVRIEDGTLKFDDSFYLTGSSAPRLAFDAGQQALAQEGKRDFADQLFREGDYDRAITEYKRRMYHRPDDSTTCLLEIASAHRRAGQYESSMQFAALALNRPDLTDRQRHDAHVTMGLDCMAMHLPTLASHHFQAAQTLDSAGVGVLCLGWLSAQGGDWSSSTQQFRQVAHTHAGDTLGNAARSLVELAGEGPRLPQRSTLLAVGMSTVVPGSGQLYAGHGFDALQAFFLTTSFALASYAAYRYESEPGRSLRLTYVSIGVTTLFHVANILSAYQTARFFNWQKRNDHLARMGELILPHAH